MNYKEFRDRQIKTSPKFKQEYLKQDLRFDVSHLITEARFYKNLSQEKLAELVGTQQPSIARIENGKTLPSLSFLEKIAKALGTYLIAPRFGFMGERENNVESVSIALDAVLPPYFYYANPSSNSGRSKILLQNN